MKLENIKSIKIHKEKLSTGKDIYIARYSPLDILSQGDTPEEARLMVIDAIICTLNTLQEPVVLETQKMERTSWLDKYFPIELVV